MDIVSLLSGIGKKGEKMTNSKENNEKVTATEAYRKGIIEMVGKIQPEHLKRIYKIVSYLYIWR